eukprot:CAMPEP_0175942564 /NCGR_PEP_ID=MMETSP0108-20121206/25017_1 /TAXON_ID=195067 ORGANISM="Goniomonas pacifica, Strain CCMP1869" /NCGR_SAMPLE_ID=MMETSP0108 /ASSEMBLY_ACC=CAM_ASM_000204 /LENGTH=63 /DNA_ID=CAMNT_0017267331 /DNA_START=69 /DNA_END=257 /DNA_ORIENTATION=+
MTLLGNDGVVDKDGDRQCGGVDAISRTRAGDDHRGRTHGRLTTLWNLGWEPTIDGDKAVIERP